MSRLRVVLDTNVVLSALLFRAGRLAWMRQTWQGGDLVPLASKDTAAELIRALAYPKSRLSAEDQEDLLADYLPWCEAARVPQGLKVPPCRDPHDRPFLALALSTRADAIVTGDADLLAMADALDAPILSPAALRARMGR